MKYVIDIDLFLFPDLKYMIDIAFVGIIQFSSVFVLWSFIQCLTNTLLSSGR